jgi:LacI family transcriptional regulator
MAAHRGRKPRKRGRRTVDRPVPEVSVTPQRRVALLIETSNAYARGLLRGVTSYLREHRPWSLYISEHGRGDSVPHWLQGWNGDGILARIENRNIAQAVAERKLPTVDLSAARLLPGVPWAETDDAAIARMAFEHLRERGFRQLGFCGLTPYNWAIGRRDEFVKLAGEAGCSCSVHMTATVGERASEWSADQSDLAGWLQGLPKPVGIFACFDIHGFQVLDACRSARLRVPDDVAVIGVDNDPVLCELSHPPLSSVAPDTHQTGYVAAQLLDSMMNGTAVPPAPHLVRPIGVVARRSTDALAIEDADLSAAVRFIREHACEGIGIDQVLKTVPLSRRALETRFSKQLGRTPHDEIVRIQVERAKELLVQTELPLKAISARVGILHSEYFSVVFKRVTGHPPGGYRRQHRKSYLASHE